MRLKSAKGGVVRPALLTPLAVLVALSLGACGGSGLSDADRKSFLSAYEANQAEAKQIGEAEQTTTTDYETGSPYARTFEQGVILLRGLSSKAGGSCKSSLEELIKWYRFGYLLNEGEGSTVVKDADSVPPESAGIVPDETVYKGPEFATREEAEKVLGQLTEVRKTASKDCGFDNPNTL